MNKFNQWLRMICTVLAAALMAGCSAFLIMSAFGCAPSWISAYGAALFASAAVQLGRKGNAWAIGAGALLALSFGGLLILHGRGILDLARAWMQQKSALDFAAHASAAGGAALLLALVLGALFSALIRSSAGSPFLLIICVAAAICALTIRPEISVWTALPGMIAGVAAVGMPGASRRDGVRPALVVPAIVLALMAFVLSPANHLTWEPLENLAQQLRAIVEDYVRFTEERIAFSINEQGYDHAGMIGENVVAMLGGPADPAGEAVMQVSADGETYLRGTIKRSYTGYSWVDDTPKARYLYYDFTHRGVRNDVFDADAAEKLDGFRLKSVNVEMLSPGTSTLFVPAQMASFDMNLADAVYYNSAGEIFLTREVQAGDSYALAAYTPENDAALIAAAEKLSSEKDSGYETALAEYTALPDGIDSRVYALSVELTGHTNNPAEKALAIQEYLAKNYKYTLEGRYPEGSQDFVSWFLLQEKQGYCSYFASSMAVMCRIAGMPARYIEGYYVPAAGESVLTGRNAHAWVEVYINGLGWTAFDPTARALQGEGSNPGEDGYSHHAVEDEPGRESLGGEHPEDEPTPSPTPDIGSNPDPTPENDIGDTPTPTPDPSGGDQSDPPPPEDQTPPENPQSQDDPPENNQDQRSRAWLFITIAALLLLILIILAVLWVKKRLYITDPIYLCTTVKSSTLAAMILYRSSLTLLSQMGLAPMNGETPQAFAQRATVNIGNPAYEIFVDQVATARYSGREISMSAIKNGCEAYAVFHANMRFGEKLRFTLRRIFHGLGSFENIP